MYDKELYHYGVKGMRWGVRRYQNPDGTLTAKGKKHYKKSATKIKPVEEMSDDELRQRLTRLRMEEQYDQLSKKDVSKGKDVVDKVVKAGTTIATLTTSIVTIHSNWEKIKKILDKASK